MRHIRPVTRSGLAQLPTTEILQLVNVVNALLSLFCSITAAFGINIPTKSDNADSCA